MCSNSCNLIAEYRSAVLQSLPQVEVLDGTDRQGNAAAADNILADIPGLEDYMDYLLSNGSSVRYLYLFEAYHTVSYFL